MQKIKEAITWASGNSDLISRELHENGLINSIILSCNDTTNPITFEVKILDDDDNAIYTKSDFAENATELVTGLAIPVDYGFKLTVEPSGDPGVSTAITYTKLFVEKR